MKKFLYFAATALGLSVIFGAGWAAGTGKTVCAPATETAMPGQTAKDPSGTDGEHGTPDKIPCPDGGREDRDDGKIRFGIPSPSDFPGRFSRLPHYN